MQKKRMFWYDARSLSTEEKVLPLVYNLRFEYLLLKQEMYKRIKAPRKMNLIVEVNKYVDMEELAKDVIILSSDAEVLQQARNKGHRTAYYRRIESQEDMDLAWQIGSNALYLVVELSNETNIPLELLIARLQGKDTALLKIVNSLKDAKIAFGVMEAGSEGAVIQSEDIEEILEVDKFMHKEELSKLELTKAKVIDVQHIGMGYRACIDTTNLLKKDEGMIIGSTSNGGLLVSSETHYLPYMELRPFRVNAGAVHSYVWAPNGMTAYLTELKAGSMVLCVDNNGNAREVSVGRTKIEMRPLLKIEAESNGTKINAVVQDDWHIRIFGGNGEVRNASTIQAGDELLAYICPGGRHVGVKIDENLEER